MTILEQVISVLTDCAKSNTELSERQAQFVNTNEDALFEASREQKVELLVAILNSYLATYFMRNFKNVFFDLIPQLEWPMSQPSICPMYQRGTAYEYAIDVISEYYMSSVGKFAIIFLCLFHDGCKKQEIQDFAKRILLNIGINQDAIDEILFYMKSMYDDNFVVSSMDVADKLLQMNGQKRISILLHLKLCFALAWDRPYADDNLCVEKVVEQVNIWNSLKSNKN